MLRGDSEKEFDLGPVRPISELLGDLRSKDKELGPGPSLHMEHILGESSL